ncbi:hypothetical protein OESDEN_06533 [Oesophagostomum dentatum]|uniref:Peroxin/Ferlin domain-containing protein n=1 Tax=Oesophagostomum dentatum TaxID=61180 RepID=A0A0B1TBQ0_OESDE|nr:hypothetical protein OESDEN_06533 [Oesophagostomum dentatum]
MGNGYLWLLNADGVPYRVTADAKIEHISDAQWKPEPAIIGGQRVKLCQIVSAPHAAFALDSSGAVYQFVLSSHLTIRQKVEVYSNQRWYPVIGWSSRTLPTDRGSFSNEDGSKSGELTGFHLKSDGWRWEEPWTVDVDVRRHDKEVLCLCLLSMNLELLRQFGGLKMALDHLFGGGAGKDICVILLLRNGQRRVGIHANNPDGDDWQEVDGIITEGSSYTEVGEGIYRTCLNAKDQVVGVSDSGAVYIREGISCAEISGRTFLKIVQRVSCEQRKWITVTNTGADYVTLPKHWVSDHVVVTNRSNYKDAEWRKKILEELATVNEACWEAFNSLNKDLEDLVEDDEKSDLWKRKSRAKLRKSGERRFFAGMVYLGVDKVVFQYSTGGGALTKSLTELTSAVRKFDHGTSLFTVFVRFATQSLELAYTEESVRDEWHELLQQEFSDSTVSSLCIPGCMKSVSAGAEGIVWALSREGTVYALSSDYNPVCGHLGNLTLFQKSEVVREIVEYQRHAFLRGFITFRESSHGISGWMEGLDSVDGLYDKLPSREWSWVDPEWRLIGTEKSEDGWAYSDVVDGEYNFGRKKGRFRRRIWKRRCLYTGRGPWITVEAPPLCCVEVQKTNADRILVWAVTMNGQVMVRQGVTPGHPQGTIWKHITSDYNIASISVASPTCVWATTVEGRLLRRECIDQTDMECIDWAEIVYSSLKKVFCFCASSDYVFILPATDPGLVVIDVKRGLSKACIALPKAVHLSLDHENCLYYCDGSEVVKLGRSSISGTSFPIRAHSSSVAFLENPLIRTACPDGGDDDEGFPQIFHWVQIRGAREPFQ